MSNNSNGTLTVANPSMNTIITNGTSGSTLYIDNTYLQKGYTYVGGSGSTTLQAGTSYTFPSVTIDMASYFNAVMEGQLQQDPDAFATSLNQILKNHPDLLEELQRKLDRDAMTRDLKEMVEGNEEQDTP